MRRLLALAIVVTVASSGCLGSVAPAEIPKSSLDKEGWTEKQRSSQSLALGIGEAVTIDYGTSSGFNGATVATVNDIPILDERERLVPIAIERIEEQRGVTFQESGESTIQLSNLQRKVTGTVYNIQGGPAPAKALLFTPGCSDFVVVVPWGATTSPGGGPLGGGGGDTLFQEAKSVAKGVVCG